MTPEILRLIILGSAAAAAQIFSFCAFWFGIWRQHVARAKHPKGWSSDAADSIVFASAILFIAATGLACFTWLPEDALLDQICRALVGP